MRPQSTRLWPHVVNKDKICVDISKFPFNSNTKCEVLVDSALTLFKNEWFDRLVISY
jgi:hypothetical protein